MRTSPGWQALALAMAVNTAGCFRYVEATGPQGIIETRPGSILFDRIGLTDSVQVAFTTYNRTGSVVTLIQCPDRLALTLEKRQGDDWAAVPELRCDGPQPEREVSLADGVFFPGSLRIAESGFYRMGVVLAPGNLPGTDAPPSVVFEVR